MFPLEDPAQHRCPAGEFLERRQPLPTQHARQLVASAAPGNARLIFNDRLDAVVTIILVVMVALILLESGLEWARVLSGRKQATVKEAPFVTSRFATEEQV